MAAEFDGQTALVIGGASGMGLATGRLLAQNGAHVVLADQDGAAVDREVRALADLGLAVSGQVLDACSAEARACLFEHVATAHGGVNLLFNTLGSHGPDGLSLDQAAYDQVFELNVRVHYLTIVEALPLLRARAPKASVVVMSSAGGLRYAGRSPLYAITKAATVMMAQALARELGPEGIRVNAICPGAVDTPFAGSHRDPATQNDGLAAWARSVPMRRVATVDDVAQTVAFLASAGGAYLTGLALPIEGGALLV